MAIRPYHFCTGEWPFAPTTFHFLPDGGSTPYTLHPTSRLTAIM
ncbi:MULTISPECIES: hypothetical protein [Planktothricoides]|nr:MULTISPECIES: hypothetical protein [Planktothricoides]